MNIPLIARNNVNKKNDKKRSAHGSARQSGEFRKTGQRKAGQGQRMVRSRKAGQGQMMLR